MPHTDEHPCDRFRLIPNGIDWPTHEAIELLGSMRVLAVEAPGIASVFAERALAELEDPGECLWRLERIAAYLKEHRPPPSASNA